MTDGTTACEGQTVLITGGARGLGKAFGHALAAESAHVVLVDIDGDAADTIAAELSPDTKTRVKAQQLLPDDGLPEHIADALLFLTSPRARFITGEIVRVTGGMAAGV